jgi:hypothetical protein
MELPISRSQAIAAVQWLKANFGAQIAESLRGTAFDIDHACGIACQETASVWVHWINEQAAQTIVERCVFDASGDYPGTKRLAFPRDTRAFRQKYGDVFADMLIAEANETRALRHYGPAQWVYKGYGIFQYDLQHIGNDRAFFEQKQWYSFDACLERLKRELLQKFAAHPDVRTAIRAYNGAGPRAENYADNVMLFTEWSRTVQAGK